MALFKNASLLRESTAASIAVGMMGGMLGTCVNIDGPVVAIYGLQGEAVADAYKRLLKPSIETEFASAAKEQADEEAIKVFADNLRQLLLAAPLGQKRVMAIDPGFRTGCKVACLDAQGNLTHHEAIFPDFCLQAARTPHTADAAMRVNSMAHTFGIEAVAIGNGTASRETEAFIKRLALKQADGKPVPVFVVSEDGASVYSASKTAREEFPDKEFVLKVYERVSNFLEIALGCGMDSIFEFNLKRFCTTFNYTATPVLNALKILTISGYIEFIEETDTLSRVMILVHKEELYNLRDCDPQTDRVLQCLLRSYTGLFADYIYIHEDLLAQRLGIDQHAVYEALLKLNRLHVLHYVPRRQHYQHAFSQQIRL